MPLSIAIGDESVGESGARFFLLQTRLALGQLPASRRRRVAPDDLPHSHLATSLIEMVGRGYAHVSKAASLARAAVSDSIGEDGAAHCLEAFASCGCGGKFESNAERDYLRWTKGLAGLKLEPYEISLTLQASRIRSQTRFVHFR